MKRFIGCIIAGIFALFGLSPAGAATLAVDWGGDYITTTASFPGSSNTNRGGFTSGSPNLINPTGYTGPNLYGHLTSTTSFTLSGGTQTGVNNATNDQITVKTVGASSSVNALILFNQSDFLNSLNTGNVGFTGTDTFSLNVTNIAQLSQARIVLRTAGSYYISSTAFTGSTGLLSLTPTTLTWQAYNPASSLSTFGAITDILTSGSIQSVTEVGFYVGGSTTSGSNRWSADAVDINMTAIPEPSTYGLLGSGLLSLWFLRRKKKA